MQISFQAPALFARIQMDYLVKNQREPQIFLQNPTNSVRVELYTDVKKMISTHILN